MNALAVYEKRNFDLMVIKIQLNKIESTCRNAVLMTCEIIGAKYQTTGKNCGGGTVLLPVYRQKSLRQRAKRSNSLREEPHKIDKSGICVN